jgi:hypothetical protein
MKNIFALTACLAFFVTSGAFADSVPCSGSVTASAATSSGRCLYTDCTGVAQDVLIGGSGTCGINVSFTLTLQSAGEVFDAQCMSYAGQLAGSAQSQSINVTGNCSNGGLFFGQAYLNGGSVSGDCAQDGPFTASLSESGGSISGTCTSVN